MTNPFTLHTTQHRLLAMAQWYAQQEPISYHPRSLSHLDAYILVVLRVNNVRVQG